MEAIKYRRASHGPMALRVEYPRDDPPALPGPEKVTIDFMAECGYGASCEVMDIVPKNWDDLSLGAREAWQHIAASMWAALAIKAGLPAEEI